MKNAVGSDFWVNKVIAVLAKELENPDQSVQQVTIDLLERMAKDSLCNDVSVILANKNVDPIGDVFSVWLAGAGVSETVVVSVAD